MKTKAWVLSLNELSTPSAHVCPEPLSVTLGRKGKKETDNHLRFLTLGNLKGLGFKGRQQSQSCFKVKPMVKKWFFLKYVMEAGTFAV